ncbi:SDR family NAD(P)-dependent oxidoreductase [Streptomyces sp. NPDC091268]|uniref:SDR family NAD(P)-dependent oxidoreductase n=1 Tax=Streptomyces sp. NPDC091268 TaxID=3365979 RepID=UPI0037F81D18
MSTLANTGRPDIAVIGMAAVMPGARDLDAFWSLIREGREAVTHGAPRVVEEAESGRRWVHARGVMDGVKDFDAEFFGIPKREAEVLDPQHRHLLQCAWNAMEDAGHDPYRIAEDVAVYSSVGPNTYYEGREFGPRSAAERMLIQLSNGPDTLPTRISYKLGLTGESVNVQSACSSAAVAVHLACEALREGRAGMALVGAASIGTADTLAYEHQEGFILSADGSTRAYDSKGSGYVEGDGVGVLVLRRLADARRDGDVIHAVIKGSAVNNDGRAKAGFSAPSVTGQSKVIRTALEASGVPAESIGLVEGHGTGTLVGDPIEVRGLTRAYQAYTSKTGYVALGSVKANIGHLCFASGIAGLLKAILCLKHGEIPPMAVFDELNPHIELDATPFYINRELKPWKAEVRRAGVSCFGMGGTNAHFVLEQAPEPQPDTGAAASDGPYAVLLSGRTEEALAQVRERLREFVAARPETVLADLAFTLAAGRRPLAHRWAAVVDSTAELERALGASGAPGAPGSPGGEVAAERESTAADIVREWVAGGSPDWAAQFTGRRPRRVALPTYPWQGERLWIEPSPAQGTASALLEPEEQAPLSQWLYRPVWTRTSLPRPYHRGDLPDTDGTALVIGDGRPMTESVREELDAAGLTCVLVEPGTAFEADRERLHVRIRPADAEDAARLVEWAVAAGGPIRKVVRLSPHATAGQREAIQLGVLSMLSLVQALAGAAQTPEIWVVTENAQPAQGEATTLDLEASALIGLCRVIPQEHSGISCHCVDFSAGSTPAEVVPRLLAEMSTSQDELEVVYRGGDRMTSTVERVEAEPGLDAPLQTGGVYLITGGLGRIGLTLAEKFARTARVRLALVSRRGLDAADTGRRQAVRALEELGAEVRVFAADVADEGQMEQVVKQIAEAWGPVNGVVHAAGIEEGRNFSLLSETTTGQAVDALRPKVPGIAALDRATRAQPLDFCLVCSSLDTLLGGIAFGVYTAANRYLDSYAHWRRAHGAPWVSVDWDSWRFDENGGARIGAAAARTAIRREQGGELLGSILALGEAQCAVSTVPLEERIERIRLTFARKDESGEHGEARRVTEDEVGSVVRQIVAEVAEVEAVADEDELLAVGCDSLALLEVVSRVEHALQVKVPLARFWGCTTVGELVDVGWDSVPKESEGEADAGREALQHLAG